MMTAALNLVTGMAAAGVRRWDWLPAPTADDIANPAAWATRRLAERRTEQDAADRPRRWEGKIARAFGQSQPASNGGKSTRSICSTRNTVLRKWRDALNGLSLSTPSAASSDAKTSTTAHRIT